MAKKAHKKGFKNPSREITSKLNKLFKYKFKPRGFKESEYKDWKAFREKVKLPISKSKDIDYICITYSEVMNVQYFKPVANSMKPLIFMVDKLNIIYDSYE